jgi:hypothetical protein
MNCAFLVTSNLHTFASLAIQAMNMLCTQILCYISFLGKKKECMVFEKVSYLFHNGVIFMLDIYLHTRFYMPGCSIFNPSLVVPLICNVMGCGGHPTTDTIT